MSNNSHVVVQWTIKSRAGKTAACDYDTDFEVYELDEGFEFVIDIDNQDGAAFVVLDRDKVRTLAERLLSVV